VLSVERQGAERPCFAATRCCRWTIASVRCSRPSRQAALQAVSHLVFSHPLPGKRLTMNACIHLTANGLQSNLPRGDLAEVQTAEGKQTLFVAIDGTSKFAHLRLEKRAGKIEAAQFLRDLQQALAYRIHTVLIDNDIQFTNHALDAHTFMQIFDPVYHENGIKHRVTKVSHP
jgi:hypothetical protein